MALGWVEPLRFPLYEWGWMKMNEDEVPQLAMMPEKNSCRVKCKFLSNEIPGPLVVKGFFAGLIMKNYSVMWGL